MTTIHSNEEVARRREQLEQDAARHNADHLAGYIGHTTGAGAKPAAPPQRQLTPAEQNRAEQEAAHYRVVDEHVRNATNPPPPAGPKLTGPLAAALEAVKARAAKNVEAARRVYRECVHVLAADRPL